MSNCNICLKIINIPYKLSCGDTFCYLCIKNVYSRLDVNCPVCKQSINIDFNNTVISDPNLQLDNLDTNYQWLYSSVFTDNWWCYDPTSNKTIEESYNKFVNDNKAALSNINIGNLTYRIDFTQMRQYYAANSNKQRKIKRIEIPKDTNKFEYLKQNHNVFGLAGIKI